MIATIKRILLILLLISSSVYAEEEILLEQPTLLEADVAKEVVKNDFPSNLFEEQLTHTFENGPFEKLHFWGAIQNNMNSNIPADGDVDNLFNTNASVFIDGKLKGGKEDFRLMFNASPPAHKPFFQQITQDLYIETHRIPHHKVLIGNSRPGIGIEGTQSPYTLPFVNRSQISRNFANMRKFGIKVRGDYKLVDYDIGGYSSDTFFREFFPGAEFDGWVNLKPLGKTNGRYGKLITGGGISSGTKNSTDYFLTEAYVGYEYKNLWMHTEYANANGSNGGDGLTNKRRQGWYVAIGYHLTKKLETVIRYDEFDPDRKIRSNNKREYTAGINYYIKGQALKLVLDYVFCQNQASTNSHKIIIGTQLAL